MVSVLRAEKRSGKGWQGPKVLGWREGETERVGARRRPCLSRKDVFFFFALLILIT